MAKMTGQEIFDKYKQNMSNASAYIERGVNTTTKSQSGNAIAAEPKMRANWEAAMNAGRYKKGLEKSGDAKWKRNMVTKGIPKIGAGIEANKPEIIAQFEKVASAGEAVSNLVQSMPKTTFEDSVQRVRASMEGMKSYWGK